VYIDSPWPAHAHDIHLAIPNHCLYICPNFKNYYMEIGHLLNNFDTNFFLFHDIAKHIPAPSPPYPAAAMTDTVTTGTSIPAASIPACGRHIQLGRLACLLSRPAHVHSTCKHAHVLTQLPVRVHACT